MKLKSSVILFGIVLIGLSTYWKGFAQSSPPEVDLFSDLVPVVEDVVIIPVIVPNEVHPRTDDALYPEIIDLRPQSYELAYGKVPNCSNAGFCREGWVQGYQIGTNGYANQTFEELTARRELDLENGTKASADSIQTVSLKDGTRALVLPWYGYAHPSATEVIFDRDGYRYVYAVIMADNQYVIDLANSSLEATE